MTAVSEQPASSAPADDQQHSLTARQRDAVERARTWNARPRTRGRVVVAVLGKGGAPKTTTAACLGDAVQSLTGWGTLLIDLDAQPSLTEWLASGAQPTLVEALSGRTEAGDAPMPHEVVRTLRPGLHLMPAHDGLADLGADRLNRDVLDVVAMQVDQTLDAGLVIVDTPASQPVTTSTVLLSAAVQWADIVVLPFGMGRKAARAMQAVLLDLREVRPGVPVLLLPANVDRPDDVDAGMEVARSLRPDLRIANAVQHVVPAMRRAEDRGRLLSQDSPRSAAVRQYAAAAQVLAEMIREVQS